MSEWRHFVKICRTAPKSDVLVLVTTFVLTVVFDLVVAIEIGLLVTVILFMKRMADITHVRTWSTADELASTDQGRLKEIPAHTAVYEIDGPMFFASSDKFSAIPIKEGVKVMILRMRNVPAMDSTATRTLFAVLHACEEQGITLLISHANAQPLAVMQKAGFVQALGEDHFMPNIDAALARARELGE
jgi:SulP family sulfate permease